MTAPATDFAPPRPPPHGITIRTVGYGDVMPARHVRAAAVAEGWAGLSLFGYFVAVPSNRLRH